MINNKILIILHITKLRINKKNIIHIIKINLRKSQN